MKKLRFNQIVLLLLAVLILVPAGSCKKDDDDSDDPAPPGPDPIEYPTVNIAGTLIVDPGASLQASDLKAVSFGEMVNVGADGSFVVKGIDANKSQLVFFNNANDEPVYIGVYDPATKVIQADETSTAQALTMLNPYLIYSTQAQREEYMNAVKMNPKFTELVGALNEIYQTDAANALNYDMHPEVYQLAVQATKETLEGMKFGQYDGKATGDPPYIEDAAGDLITFVNGRHTWYAAGIYPNSQSLTDTRTVDRKETLLSFELGWPPVAVTDPARTDYALGDGEFKIHIVRGWDFSNAFNWNDPTGRGTLLNTGQAIVYVIDIAVGFIPAPDMPSLVNHFNITEDDAIALANEIAENDAQGFLIEFFELVYKNKDNLAYWLFQNDNPAAAQFVKSISGILKNAALVIKILSFANEQAPFVYDLIFAPLDVTYFITQSGGVITSSTQNDSPVPEFSVDPPAGVVGTEFTFDASETTDDNDPLSALQFRWDFEGNGSWSSWSSSPGSMHTYSVSGSYNVIMQAKDTEGQTGSIAHVVNVGGGAGTATHIKLFMDMLPWSNDAMESMIQTLGFTYGQGPNTYEILTSSDMSSAVLVPGEDLVIISNDQDQTFYDNYAANQVKFSNFVYMGGSMFWEACDEGWNYGSIASAGITFPGNITINLSYDYYNYVANPNLPLVSGLPYEMDHNYASHEYFSNVPDGSIIYCVDSEGGPTLVEFNLGAGWMLMTGQPLEHQYVNLYGNPDMEELLPRIVGYFTGKDPVFLKNTPRESTRPSHLPQ